jgi:hypothetical protein
VDIKATLKRRLLPITGGLVAVGLVAGGVAYATTPSAAPAKTTSSMSTLSVAPGQAGVTATRLGLRWDLIRLARHTVHAELIVKTADGFRTIDIDRGRLSSISGTSITIVRPDGPSVTARLTNATRYVGLPESSLAKGDRVLLVQGGGGNALFVAARPPATSTGATA